MHPTAAHVQALLQALGVEAEVIEFAASTRTSAEAAAVIGTSVAQICKSIVFNMAGQALLVMASGADRIAVARLEALMGQPLGKANAAFVREQTGYAIGGVAPIGHARQFPVLVERGLLQFPVVYAAAGTPNTIFAITPADLLRITGAQVVDCRETPDS